MKLTMLLEMEKVTYGFLGIFGKRCDDCGTRIWWGRKIPAWLVELSRYQFVPFIMCFDCVMHERGEQNEKQVDESSS